MLFNRCLVYLKYSCSKKRAKNVQKRAKTCKNGRKRASQVLILSKTCISSTHLSKNVQKRVSKEKNIKKRASQVFFYPIQNRALSRSVQLEAVYLEALL